MAANFNFILFVASLFVLGAWASSSHQADARTLEERSMFERHEPWMARHERSYKGHVKNANRLKISKENNVKFFECFNNLGGNRKLMDAGNGVTVVNPPPIDTIDQETCDDDGDKGRDWAPFLISAALFVLLQPGLIFQIPGNNRWIEFGTMKTSGKSIVVHTLIFIFICVIIILLTHDKI